MNSSSHIVSNMVAHEGRLYTSSMGDWITVGRWKDGEWVAETVTETKKVISGQGSSGP